MQSLAEKRLVERVCAVARTVTGTPILLNMGAGRTDILEQLVLERIPEARFDRLDIQDCQLDRPYIRSCYTADAATMSELPSGEYDLAFSNYVFEHVQQPKAAVSELFRVLKPGGAVVLTIPNPTSPETHLARLTSHRTHRMVKTRMAGAESEDVYPTHFAFGSVKDLLTICRQAGFSLDDPQYCPGLASYLSRSLLHRLALSYDRCLEKRHWNSLMSHVLISLTKP